MEYEEFDTSSIQHEALGISYPQIALKGLEYLEENSLMQSFRVM